jgi:co-chaperonin GroES (HSP10)
MQDFKVTGKRVLVRRVETEETLREYPHVVLSQEVRDGLTMGQAEVVAVGSLCQPGLNAGDWVVVKQWSLSEAPPQLGPDLWLVSEDAVLCTLEDA